MDQRKITEFLLRAKKATYAGKGPETAPSRPLSHDLEYAEGELFYIDTYLGGENFAGEEAIWENGQPIWAMNYCGRNLAEGFSGDFLKEALANVPFERPYRGPEEYRKDDFVYKCSVTGDFHWFSGYEEIFRGSVKVYECIFHGGDVK